MSIELMMPFNHLILRRPLLLLPSIFPSIRVFSNESALHIRWPKYWSFSFSISPSNEYSDHLGESGNSSGERQQTPASGWELVGRRGGTLEMTEPGDWLVLRSEMEGGSRMKPSFLLWVIRWAPRYSRGRQ